MKIVNPLLYVYHWCGSHLGQVYSLNKHTTLVLLAHQEIPRIPGVTTSKSLSCKTSSNVIKSHPYAHPHHTKILNHILHVCHWCWSHLGQVYSLNHYTILLVAPLEAPRIMGSKLPKAKAWPTRLAVTWWGVIHMHIHCRCRLWNTSYMLSIDVEAILDGTIA